VNVRVVGMLSLMTVSLVACSAPPPTERSPSPSIDAHLAALITGGCANTAYERCEEDLLLARTFGPRALVAVCDYGDGTGEVVQIWRKRDARNACSVDGGISSPLAAVVRMP